MKTSAEISAERACDIADARLGVVEDLRWYIAFLLSCCVYLRWDSWIGAVLIYWVPIFLLPHFYAKESDAAHDQLERLTGTGKYWKGNASNDSSK